MSLQLAADRGIDDRVADGDPRAADQLRIDAYRRFDFLAEALFQRRLERAELRIVDRERADDVCPGHAVGAVLEGVEQAPDVGQYGDAIGFQQHANKAPSFRAERVAAKRKQQRFLGRSVQLGIVERGAHRGIVRDVAGDLEHFGPPRQSVLLAGERKRCFGIGAGDGDLLRHGVC